MPVLGVKGKHYEVDELGFLMDFDSWDEDFARTLAPRLRIPDGLTSAHWSVIRYIQSVFQDRGHCPRVAQTCRDNGLLLRDLEELFPTGYLRGACKLAGITYREGHHHGRLSQEPVDVPSEPDEKTYEVDDWGFLVDAADWDEDFAAMRAAELGMPELTDTHWDVIAFMRRSYAQTGIVPTVYETCTANGLEIEQFAGLFPDGYHRGAVRIAGLRAAR